MPVVIDQFEVIRDQQAAPAASAPGSAPAKTSDAPGQELRPQDIGDTHDHLMRRAARLQAS